MITMIIFFSEENAYFDGKEFHLYDINLQDNANWIDDWVYFATTWRYDGGEKYIREVNKGWRLPNQKYCKFNPETKKVKISCSFEQLLFLFLSFHTMK